jgi:ligand-binding sensor domain-containing protein
MCCEWLLNFISKGSIDFEDKSYYFALTHIATDSEGDIWFSYFCERGLDTDGVVCNNTAYNTLDGLADDNVRYITPDDSGVVWCATDGGISKFTGTKWVTYNTTHGIASNLVYKVLIGSDYTLYAATDKGISLLKSNQWKTLKTINEPLHNNYTDMIADKNGLMVFAGENHIARYMDLQWSSMDLKNIRVGFSMYDHFLYSKDLFSRYANYKSFFKSKDGSLYAIGNDNEKGWILKQDAEGKTFSKAYSCDIQKSNGHLLPGVACSGNDSCFWLTSRRNDLILFKNGSTESFPPTDFNINYNKRISSMLLDRDGRSVWVGYASGDIIHVDGNSNTVKKHISDALASDEVTAIARDSSDNLWFASRNEKRSGWVTVLHDNKLTKYLLDSTNKVFGGCNCPYRKIYPPLLSRVLYFCL